MKALLSLGLIAAAMTFCNLADRLKQVTGNGDGANRSVNSGPGSPSNNNSGQTKGDVAEMSPSQRAIADAAAETAWNEQGISWRLPVGWKKMDVKKEMFNYSGPDGTFLLVNISPLPDNFPMETSMNAYYEQAMQQLKNGKYQSAKITEIDGVMGVEFIEAPPEEKNGIRRHQWIGYREYLGQKQQVNVMTTTSGSKFDKHNDAFTAIMYSAAFTK